MGTPRKFTDWDTHILVRYREALALDGEDAVKREDWHTEKFCAQRILKIERALAERGTCVVCHKPAGDPAHAIMNDGDHTFRTASTKTP